ncbi:MAG: energy-coupling factor ABC transporter ATP-binding protein [Actinomycetota bacterium]
MAQFLIEYEHIYYTYLGSQQPALNNLNLRLQPGKKSVLIGQNGSGKTTLFLLANGLYKPQKGKIYWKGKPLDYHRQALTALRQKVGLVFQNPEQQLVATTVEEDISYGLCNLELPTPEIAQRVEHSLLQFGLTELATQPVHNLSLGQKKQVSLADVMVLQPELLLLDEPTAYLDHLHTRQLMAALEKIHNAGTTILIATHDLDLAYRWADWIFVMDKGQLVLEGNPQDVFSQRQKMEDLQLGVPLVFEILSEISQSAETQTASEAHPIATQVLEQWQKRLLQLFKHF